MVAFLYICNASKAVIAALSLILFFLTLGAGLLYIFVIQKRENIIMAVRDLANAFRIDVETILKSPIALSNLEKEVRVLIVVDAVSVLKNLLI